MLGEHRLIKNAAGTGGYDNASLEVKFPQGRALPINPVSLRRRSLCVFRGRALYRVRSFPIAAWPQKGERLLCSLVNCLRRNIDDVIKEWCQPQCAACSMHSREFSWVIHLACPMTTDVTDE